MRDRCRSTYRMPPEEIREIVDTPSEPSLSFSPDRKWVLELNNPPPLPPVAELSRPDVRIGGLRIDPVQNSRARMAHYVSAQVVEVTDSLALPSRQGETSQLRCVHVAAPALSQTSVNRF